MRILVFSLFLCLNLFTSNAQSNSKFTSATLLVNGAACDKCTIELTREQLKNAVFATNEDSVKIISFKVKVPGKATKPFKGNQSGSMNNYIHKTPYVGDHITFFDIMTNKGLLKNYVIVKLIN